MIRVTRRPAGNYAFSESTVDEEGAAVTATGPFTFTLKDGAGTAILSNQTATYAAGTLSATIAYSNLQLLDTYSITWTGTVDGQAAQWVSDIELVGGHMYTLAQLRAADSSGYSTLTDPQLAQVRIEVEQTIEAEDASKVAFVPRGRRVKVSGKGMRHLVTPDLEMREVYAVSVAGVAWDAPAVAGITVSDDRLVLPTGQTWPVGVGNIDVHYSHGRSRTPTPMRRAGIKLSKEYLSTGDIDGRATAQAVGDQMFRLTIAGRDGITGLPEVDAAINQHGRKYRSG